MSASRRSIRGIISVGTWWSWKTVILKKYLPNAFVSALLILFLIMSTQRGSMSINFSKTLLWLYPTSPHSHGKSVSLHSLLRILKFSKILTSTFLSALLNPAPKVYGSSLQPTISYIIKQVLLFSLPQRRWKHTKNIYKTIWLSSKSLLSCQAHREAQQQSSRCAKTIVQPDSHHSLLPSLLRLFVMFLWP